MRRGAFRAVLACLLLAGAAAAPAQEQGGAAERRFDFLLLNQERILTDSARGQALLAEEEAARDGLRSEARAVESAFEAEERELTQRRESLSPEEFRALADDFDARVVQARQDQDARAAALAAEFDQRRRAFYAEVAPILVGVMESFGAAAIFDETSVLLADHALNITDEVIEALDREPGEGEGQDGTQGQGAAPQPGAAGSGATETEAPEAAPPTGDGGG